MDNSRFDLRVSWQRAGPGSGCALAGRLPLAPAVHLRCRRQLSVMQLIDGEGQIAECGFEFRPGAGDIDPGKAIPLLAE